MKQKLLTDIELDVHGLKYLMDLYSKEPAKAVLELLFSGLPIISRIADDYG